MKPIEFTAAVAKVQTLADGGIRVWLDLPESAVMQLAELAACQRVGVALSVRCTPCTTGPKQGNGKEQHELGKGAKRKSEWTPAEE